MEKEELEKEGEEVLRRSRRQGTNRNRREIIKTMKGNMRKMKVKKDNIAEIMKERRRRKRRRMKRRTTRETEQTNRKRTTPSTLENHV